MKRLTWTLAIAATLAMTACSPPSSVTPSQSGAAASASAQVSLPFKTVLDDGPGTGRFFKAGDSERVVLDNKAALDAFLQRHPREQPEGNPSNPSPPLEPFPEAVTNPDFAKYQLIAFFDGRVKLGATSRITAVRAQGDGLVVETMRWEPPPNPHSADDPVGRVHLVALPRQTRPLTFANLVVSNETSKTGGGTAVAGNPTMQPRWRAVPNPEVTQASIEQEAKAAFSRSDVTRLTVEKHTLQWVTDNLGPEIGQSMPFTEDSDVWVLTVEGDMDAFGPGGTLPGTVGAGNQRVKRIVQLLSIEDGRMWASSATPMSMEPGMHFELLPQSLAYKGDLLHFDVSGKPVEGSLKLTIQVGDKGQPFERDIAFQNLATYHQPLDQVTLPDLADVPVQRLTVTLAYDGRIDTHTIFLVRDRDAQPAPALRAVGPTDNPSNYGPSAGQEPLDAFARDIAATDWKGRNLSLTSQVVSRSELNLPSPQWDSMPASVGLRQYTVRGDFPKYLLPDAVTASGAPEVFAPKRFEIVLSDSTPIHVVSTKAFPD